jgi:hypothetical protein
MSGSFEDFNFSAARGASVHVGNKYISVNGDFHAGGMPTPYPSLFAEANSYRLDSDFGPISGNPADNAEPSSKRIMENSSSMRSGRWRTECLQSLAFFAMDLGEYSVEAEAHGTCVWLLHDERYKTWSANHRGLLWISGTPGSGKSTLLKHALRSARESMSVNNHIIASFFFSGCGAAINREPIGLLRCLVHQIADQDRDFCDKITSTYRTKCETQGKEKEKWDWHEAELAALLWDLLPEVSSSRRIRIYVDALDKCPDTSMGTSMGDLARFLAALSTVPTARISICCSCRSYPLIVMRHDEPTIFADERNMDDISVYIDQSLRKYADEASRKAISEHIRSKASTLFQWASLAVRQVLDLDREGESLETILAVIDELPQELGFLYEEIFDRIPDIHRARSLRMMKWICFAVRPLSLTELQFAMEVGRDMHTAVECGLSAAFLVDDPRMEKRVRFLSGGLAEVREQENERVVQLIHQSVLDFVVNVKLQELDTVGWSVTGMAHSWLSTCCLRYVRRVINTVERAKQLVRKEPSLLQTLYPFLPYSWWNWIRHAQEAEAEDCTQYFIFPLLLGVPNEILPWLPKPFIALPWNLRFYILPLRLAS